MKKMKIIVLGSGLVGAPMALDLATDPQFEVTVADLSAESLQKCAVNKAVKTVQADLSDPARVKELVSGQDLALNAVPGFLGFQTLKAIIESGKNAVDIAFFPEDAFLLDELAKKYKVTAIVDCGRGAGHEQRAGRPRPPHAGQHQDGADLRGRPARDPCLAL